MMMTSWDFRGTGSWTTLVQTLACSGTRMRKVMPHEWTRQVLLLPRAVAKRKKSAVLAPDAFVTDRIKALK